MSKTMRLVGWAIVLPLVLAATAEAASGDPISPEVWSIIRGLSWPSATVGALFSPPARALATWIQARAAPAAAPTGPRSQELADMTAALQEVVRHVKRSNEVQAKTIEVLLSVERSLAILMDRYPRVGGVSS